MTQDVVGACTYDVMYAATYPPEVILDCGASGHVAARESILGYMVQASPGSRAGRCYIGASDHGAPNEGQADVATPMPSEGGKVSTVRSTIQVANVTRPLLSVGRIYASGKSVVYKRDCALVLGNANKVVGWFEQKNWLYVATMHVKNPGAPAFPGQDH